MESVERTVTMTKQNAAVVTLQSCIRRCLVKNRIRTFLLSLVCIQCHIRGWAVRRNLRSRFRAAVIIQRIWRGAFIRRKTINIDSSCRVVQRMWRGFLERRKLRVRNVMSLFMQRQLRLWISRRGFSRVLNSEVSVARYIRGKYNRIQFKHSRLAAIWYEMNSLYCFIFFLFFSRFCIFYSLICSILYLFFKFSLSLFIPYLFRVCSCMFFDTFLSTKKDIEYHGFLVHFQKIQC